MDYLNSTFDLNDPELVSVFDELPLWSAPFGLKLLETINYRRNITALDIGFGNGFPLLEVAMRLGKGSKIYGIDPWKAAINRTQKKIDVYKIDNVALLECEAESVPLEDRTIDLIFSNNGINNVNNLDTVLSECSRIARQCAQFVATMNLDGTMIEFYRVMESVLKKNNMAAEVEKMKAHINSKRRPLNEVTSLFEIHGFRVRRIIEDKFYYTFASGTAFLEYHFIRMAFMDSWKNIIPHDRQKEIFTQIESALNGIAEKEGILKLTVPFAVIDCEKI